jgi:D-glycero-alpha-D-manno-heptose-7-phosphate kinase
LFWHFITLIISITPYRVSFLGGGSDYPEWFQSNRGRVLVSAIDKYCYITLRQLPHFFPHKYRVVYSKIDEVQECDEIRHPVIRAFLRAQPHVGGYEIHHDGDLPARSGVGSSSAFAVGFIAAWNALGDLDLDRYKLAQGAIHLEREVLGETVGCQDQYISAMGGLRVMDFDNEGVRVRPLKCSKEWMDQLCDSTFLVFSGANRVASEIASTYVDRLPQQVETMSKVVSLADDAIAAVELGDLSMSELGKMVGESWDLKRQLSNSVSSTSLDASYERAVSAGAWGGKVMGAGGGGFFLFVAPKEKREAIRTAVSPRAVLVDFKIDHQGVRTLRLV